MGNTVVWKPASSAMFSAHYLMQLFEAAGLPPGVINFVAGDAAMISDGPLVAPRSGRRPFHRQHRGLQQHVEDDRRVDGHVPFVSAHRRRNRRQGLRPRASVRGSGGAGGRDRSRRLRVSGTEVLGRQPHLHSAIDLERRPRSDRRDDRRDQDGRRARLPQLHGRRHRQARVRQDHRIHRRRARTSATIVAGGTVRLEQGLFHPADARRDDRSGLSARCARRFSDRSSRRTSTTMPSGRRRWRWWTRRRRTR